MILDQSVQECYKTVDGKTNCHSGVAFENKISGVRTPDSKRWLNESAFQSKAGIKCAEGMSSYGCDRQSSEQTEIM
jgi:hypothetical protein